MSNLNLATILFQIIPSLFKIFKLNLTYSRLRDPGVFRKRLLKPSSLCLPRHLAKILHKIGASMFHRIQKFTVSDIHITTWISFVERPRKIFCSADILSRWVCCSGFLISSNSICSVTLLNLSGVVCARIYVECWATEIAAKIATHGTFPGGTFSAWIIDTVTQSYFQ